MEIVNGYMCRDCTDVANAKKNIDPAHPKDGPQGSEKAHAQARFGAAVDWGGQLAQRVGLSDPTQASQAISRSGTNPAQQVNLLA